MPYLIDEVLPTNRVHLLGGVSDAGKTRFLLPMLLDWQQGKQVLGRAVHPVPWVYVAGDRLIQEVHDTMQTMGVSATSLRVMPAFGPHRKNYLQVLLAASQMQPQPELIVWEGFSDLCGESRAEVAEFLGNMGAYCSGTAEFPKGFTVLGVVESPKQKPYERYPNPRQRISGTSAWGYHSSTILLLESMPKDEALETPERTLWICTKNAKRRRLIASFDLQGRLIVP